MRLNGISDDSMKRIASTVKTSQEDDENNPEDQDYEEDFSGGGMSESEFEEFLMELIEETRPGTSVRTYGDLGMMTSNKGLVVKIGDKEFQITIVRRN